MAVEAAVALRTHSDAALGRKTGAPHPSGQEQQHALEHSPRIVRQILCRMQQVVPMPLLWTVSLQQMYMKANTNT